MSDRKTSLAAANTRHHQQTVAAARRAIEILQRSGSSVTFAAVAKTAGVSRTWLYKQTEIRQLIGRLRNSAPPPAIDSDRATAQSLRRMAEALRFELNRLKQENKALRDQMARQLGARRAQQGPPKDSDGEDMSTPSTPPVTRASS